MLPRVLVVEDELSAAQAYETILVGNYLSILCSCVSEAISFVQRNPPQVVLTDLQLAGETGIELLEFLQNYPGIGRVVVSGFGSRFVGDLINDVSVDRFLSKPILKPELLIHALGEALKIGEKRVLEQRSKSPLKDEFLTISEVCDFLKVSRTTVFNWIKFEGLKSVKLRGARRFRKVDLFDWYEKHLES
jgi:excisionase family DNA binding protein